MDKIINFAIFPNKKEKDIRPDYRVSARIGEEYVSIGAGWKKDGKNGSKFLSIKLSEPFDGKDGYFIGIEKGTNKPILPKFDRDSKGNKIGGDKPFTLEEVQDVYPKVDITPEDIPF